MKKNQYRCSCCNKVWDTRNSRWRKWGSGGVKVAICIGCDNGLKRSGYKTVKGYSSNILNIPRTPRIKGQKICHCGEAFRQVPERAEKNSKGWKWKCKNESIRLKNQRGCNRIIFLKQGETING